MKQHLFCSFILLCVYGQLSSQNSYFNRLKQSKLYVETVEPPMQLFFQGLAFKREVGDTTINGKTFAKINFERFNHSSKITDISRLYELISPDEYTLLDRNLNLVHQFRTDADSTINGYVFGWNGTVKRVIKSQSPDKSTFVADYFIERDTSQRITLNGFLNQVETYRRNSGFTRLLVGNFASDFEESFKANRTFLPKLKLNPGDEFESTLYNWEFDNQTFDFKKVPRSLLKCNYLKDSIVDDTRISYLKMSSIDLDLKFEEINPLVEMYHSDTCWFFSTGQLVSYTEQKTYAKIRTLNDKKDSTYTFNPLNFDDDMQGQYIVLNYINQSQLENFSYKLSNNFKSDQQGIFACYDFLPVPFLVPPSFDAELTYIKRGKEESGKKYQADYSGNEPILASFFTQDKKVEFEVFVPDHSHADLVLSPYEGVEKLKISRNQLKKGIQKITMEYPMLENLSYYYLYINLTFNGKTRTLSHLFQAKLTN
jgi:hypothetical protein